MAFIRNLFLALAVLVAALVLLNWWQTQSAPPAPPPVAVVSSPRPAVPAAPAEPEYRPGSAPPGFAAPRASAPTPAPAAVAAAPAPQPQRQRAAPVAARPAASSGQRAAVEAAAKKAGVKIVSYSENGPVEVKIQWVSSSEGPGGDFLDNCISEGMRDFDDLGKSFGHDKQGRQVWSGRYRLKF